MMEFPEGKNCRINLPTIPYFRPGINTMEGKLLEMRQESGFAGRGSDCRKIVD